MVSVAVRWAVGPSADQEGRWVAAAEVGMVLVGSPDRAEVHIPVPYRSLAVEAHIPVPYRHIQALRLAVQESHARRQDPEILDAADAAGTDSVVDLDSHTAVAAEDMVAEALGTDSAAVVGAVVAGGMARHVRVAERSS